MLVYKSKHNLGPKYLTDLLPNVSERRGSRSSHRGDLYIPYFRTTLAKEASFTAVAPAIWNSLPVDLKLLDDFKKSLET